MNLPVSGSGLEPYKSLTPYLATASNGTYVHQHPWVRFGFTSPQVTGRFLGNFHLFDFYSTNVMRQGLWVNNFYAFLMRFAVTLPQEYADQVTPGSPTTTIGVAAMANSGGVRLRMRSPGGQFTTVIDQPQYARSRLYCASQKIPLAVGTSTEFEFIVNIADGNSLYFDPSQGPFGGLNLMFYDVPYPGIGPADLSACGADFYDPIDPLKPAGAALISDLPFRGFFPSDGVFPPMFQVTDGDRSRFSLPICGVDD